MRERRAEASPAGPSPRSQRRHGVGQSRTAAASEASSRAAEPQSRTTPDTPTPHPNSKNSKPPPASAAKASIEREPRSPSADQVELLTFIIAGEQYAVDDRAHRRDRHAARRPRACRMPIRPIVGIISLRGTMVTVDRRPPQAAASARGAAATTRASSSSSAHGEILGFEVDRVLRVRQSRLRRRRAASRRPFAAS